MNTEQRKHLIQAIANHDLPDYLVFRDRLNALVKLSDEELLQQIPKRYEFRNPDKSRRLVFESNSFKNLDFRLKFFKSTQDYMKTNNFTLHSVTKLIKW